MYKIVRLFKSFLCGALAAAFFASGAAAVEAEWDGKYWNPQPAESDFVLPTPCGGAMAFRAVETTVQTNNWLADMEVKLGSTEETYAYAEYIRFGDLVGSLSNENDPRARLYYIGKYEVSSEQYQAISTAECPSFTDEWGAKPAENISWFDAVSFTKLYSEWLLANAPDVLPTTDGKKAFVRLPTEVEWEFAARGGELIFPSERDKRLFPMDGRLNDYVYYLGQDSCAGELGYIGVLKPNPIGLHDVLGNVSEYVLEPFRLNGVGQLHGQVGGAVARGGSCVTPRSEVRLSARTEVSYFEEEQAVAATPTMTGFRVVLAAASITGQTRIGALRDDWTKLRNLRTTETDGVDPAESLATTSESLRDAAENVDESAPSYDAIIAASELVSTAAADINREMRRRNEIEARSVQAAVRAGSLSMRSYFVDQSNLSRVLLVADEDSVNARKAQVALQISKDAYFYMVKHAAEDFSSESLQDAERFVLKELDTQFEETPPEATKLIVTEYVKQVLDFKENGGLRDSEYYFADLVRVREQIQNLQ